MSKDTNSLFLFSGQSTLVSINMLIRSIFEHGFTITR